MGRVLPAANGRNSPPEKAEYKPAPPKETTGEPPGTLAPLNPGPPAGVLQLPTAAWPS
jgi:hypothetical protein